MYVPLFLYFVSLSDRDRGVRSSPVAPSPAIFGSCQSSFVSDAFPLCSLLSCVALFQFLYWWYYSSPSRSRRAFTLPTILLVSSRPYRVSGFAFSFPRSLGGRHLIIFATNDINALTKTEMALSTAAEQQQHPRSPCWYSPGVRGVIRPVPIPPWAH